MSSASVLKALSAVTGAPLKFFSLVNTSILEDEEELCYLCFGKYAMFIVDRDMDGLERDGIMYSCPYSCMERCEADLSNAELFAVYVIAGVPLVPQRRDPAPATAPATNTSEQSMGPAIPDEDCFPEKVTFRSTDREKLLSEFETYFRTDYMFQHWQMPSSPFVVDVKHELHFGSQLSPGGALEGKAFVAPPPSADLVNETLGNYVFLRPRSFERQSGAGRGAALARFVDVAPDTYGAGAEGALPDALDIILHDMFPINKGRFALTVGGEKSISEVADHYMREIGEQVIDYRVIGVPQRHHKKTLGKDIAAFDSWKAHVRTAGRRHNTAKSQAMANRDICIMVVQRKFIPPMMDKFQNIVVIGYSRYMPLQKSQQNLTRCETVVESLAFNSKTFTCDSLVVQTKANALMLDEESYAWYASNLEVYPEAIKLARSFCQCILRILSRAGLPFTSENVFSDATVNELGDDPFEYSLRLENQVPGITDQAANPALVREWKVRVWRYLAFCVDGGLLPGILDITKVAVHVQQHPRRLQRLSQVLQMLLYFRASGEEFRQAALPLKIADERLMRNFTFNEAVMEKLLSTGYIKRVLDDTTDPLEFPRFVVRLLQRGKDRAQWGYSLQYTVCKQLARSSAALSGSLDRDKAAAAVVASGEPKASPLSDLALHTIVPALIDLLNDESTNERVAVLIVSTLVNFTKNNTVLKNRVMAGGAIRRVCQFLHSKHADLVRHSCSLLNNCTKSEQYRGQVAKFKAIEALMRLLQRNSFPPHYHSTRIIIQACAVIGNLASDTRLRQRITNALGYEIESDRTFKGARFEQSRSIRVLVDLLMDKYGELTVQRDSLRVTVIFALKNLAIRHEENKRTIGRLALDLLLGIVETAPAEDKRILVDVSLRCIYVLSFERANCKILSKLHADKVLQAKQAAFSDITRQILKKLNTVV